LLKKKKKKKKKKTMTVFVDAVCIVLLFDAVVLVPCDHKLQTAYFKALQRMA